MAEEISEEDDNRIDISLYDDLGDVIEVASEIYYRGDFWNTRILLLYAVAQLEKEMEAERKAKKEAEDGHQAEKT